MAKTTASAAGIPALSARCVDWRDIYAAAARSVRSSLAALLKNDDSLFEDSYDVFMAVNAALDLLDAVQKKRPGPEATHDAAWGVLSEPLCQVQSVLKCARTVLGDVDTYPSRVLDGGVRLLGAAYEMASNLFDEAERASKANQPTKQEAT